MLKTFVASVLIISFGGIVAVYIAHANSHIAEFTISEYFGVNHPSQIIDFDFSGNMNPAETYMIGPDGSEEPYQVLADKKIAVRANLSAHAKKTWKLMSGRAPQITGNNLVTLTNHPDYYEITNGLTGVRVFRANNQTRTIPVESISTVHNVTTITTKKNHELETAAADYPDLATGPQNITITGASTCAYLNNKSFSFNAVQYWDPDRRKITIKGVSGENCTDAETASSTLLLTLTDTRSAPIQGIQLRDGRWTATGPNKLYTYNGYSYFNQRVMNAKSIKTEILEQGPLKMVVRLSYEFTRPAQTYEQTVYPAGDGYYTSTITLEAGQPSIIVEEDTDMNFLYFLNTYSEVQQTQARYRGHSASRAELGREPDGQRYRALHERPHMDAVRDLQYETPAHLSYRGETYEFPYVSAWDPWQPNGGRYWMFYNAAEGSNTPLVGIFAGSAARAIGAHITGPGLYTAPAGASTVPSDINAVTHGGIGFMTHRRGPDARVKERSRVEWGIFVGTKGTDLAPPTDIQNIARQQNIHGGINLNTLHRVAYTYPDPSRGYGAMYIEKEVQKKIIDKLRQGTGNLSDPYFVYLYNAEPTARPLIDMWGDKTGAKTKAAADAITTLATTMLDAFVNEDGISAFHYGYWHGGLQMSRNAAFADSVLADPLTSEEDRIRVKRALALFASILWDDNFVPMNFAENMLSAGTANMPVQQAGYRNQYALFLSEHPLMKPKAAKAAADTLAIARNLINDHGAEIGSTHYIGASIGPTLNTLLQMRMSGGSDPFASEPKLAKFAEFYMNLLTPQEPRFGNARKLIAIGDGSTEGTETTGQLATGFRKAHPTLSARLMDAWHTGGKRHSGFHASTLLTIDEEAPRQDALLGDANFPGYASILRHGWNTKNESALWFVNGDFYSDHRNDDRGMISLYAHGAPLSINWGSMYYPQAAAGSMKSIVMPETRFPEWNQNNSPLNSRQSGWNTSAQKDYAAFAYSGFASAAISQPNLEWTRNVYAIRPNASLPVFLVKDTFSGPNSAADKISSFNFMAKASVKTPSGLVTPEERLNTSLDGSVNALPSASVSIPLKPGLSAFTFTGQEWNAHPTKGIDWDLYIHSKERQEAVISNWGHIWHPSLEQSEFTKANGQTFCESQHILRVKGTGDFTAFIIPYRKGERPKDLSVHQTEHDVLIKNKNEQWKINDASYSYVNHDPENAKTVVTAFSAAPVSRLGISIAGGPAEVVMGSDQAIITAHGAAGKRTVSIPGSWTGHSSLTLLQNGTYAFEYQGGLPITFTLQKSKGASNGTPSQSSKNNNSSTNGTGGQSSTSDRPAQSTEPTRATDATEPSKTGPSAESTNGNSISATNPASIGNSAPSTDTSAAVLPDTEVGRGLPPNTTFHSSLSRGARGREVTHLQRFLINAEFLAQDFDTGLFGAATEEAVKKFQKARGIISEGSPSTTGYGAVGPKTRAAIHLLLSETAYPRTATPADEPPPQPSAQSQQSPFLENIKEQLLRVYVQVLELQLVLLKNNLRIFR